MTKCYDDILSTEDLENLDSFLTSWNDVTGMVEAVLLVVPSHVGSTMDPLVERLDARRSECKDLQRKLAVAIHYSKGGDRP